MFFGSTRVERRSEICCESTTEKKSAFTKRHFVVPLWAINPNILFSESLTFEVHVRFRRPMISKIAPDEYDKDDLRNKNFLRRVSNLCYSSWEFFCGLGGRDSHSRLAHRAYIYPSGV